MQTHPSSSPEVLLVFPPQCKTALHGPHLGIPQLLGYLESHGLHARTRDLNIEFFRHITAPARMHQHIDALVERRDVLRDRAQLSGDELEELLELCQLESLRARLAPYEADARLGDDDFRRCLRLMEPALHRMPGDFDAILASLTGDAEDVIRGYYDALDLDAMCAGAGMIGISVAFHLQLYPALELARRVRARLGDRISIVLGGSQISLMTDAQRHALLRLACVDAVVVHEGEVPLLEMCRQLASAQRIDFSRVPNTYHRNDAGDVCAPVWHDPPNMSALPPPRFDEDGLAMYVEPRMLPVYVSKGCYWGKCKFCDYTKLYTPGQAKTQAWSVFRPVDDLVADMETLARRHGIGSFYLVSEAITPSYYVKLSRAILARRLRVELSSYCRVEKTYDYDFFRLLYQAGVRALTFGVEATQDRVLALIDKGNTVADIRNTIRGASAAGIEVIFNLIPDYPTITWAEVERTVGFLRDNIDFIGRLNHQFFDLSANSIIAEEEESHGLSVEKSQNIQTQHGIHSLAYVRKRGLTPAQLRRVRTLFDHLAADIVVYRKTVDLVNRTRSAHFDWNRATFLLAGDIESFQLAFDPSAPVTVDGVARFERLASPVLILASREINRHVSCSPAVSAIVDVATAQGLFSVDDILRRVGEIWKLASVEALRRPMIQCLESLLEEGFIDEIFHPWQGAPSKKVAAMLAAEAPMTAGNARQLAVQARHDAP